MQNLILPPLWALAKVFGVRGYYDRGGGQPDHDIGAHR
jgi:hypothetical protein